MRPSVQQKIAQFGSDEPPGEHELDAQRLLQAARVQLEDARSAYHKASELMASVCSHPQDHLKHVSMSFDDTLGNYTGRSQNTLTCSVCSDVLIKWYEGF